MQGEGITNTMRINLGAIIVLVEAFAGYRSQSVAVIAGPTRSAKDFIVRPHWWLVLVQGTSWSMLTVTSAPSVLTGDTNPCRSPLEGIA